MKPKRNLSGIYIRFKNSKTNKSENRTFEDLPPEEQDKILNGHSIEWIKSLSKQLADTLNSIGERFNLYAK